MVGAFVDRADGEEDLGDVCVFPTMLLLPSLASTMTEALPGLVPALSPPCGHLVRSVEKSLQVGTNSQLGSVAPRGSVFSC